MNRFCISLENLRFYARIGVLAQERSVGNEFRVDVRFFVDATSFIPEDLSSTVSYADVYEMVSEIMGREWLLLESVAKEIGDRIAQTWPETEEISVKITKLGPPISGILGECAVEYFL